MILGKEPKLEKAIFVKLPNKHFDTMSEMLKDAEKYLDCGEKQVATDILYSLIEYIERYKTAIK